jgi:hypothetical protein
VLLLPPPHANATTQSTVLTTTKLIFPTNRIGNPPKLPQGIEMGAGPSITPFLQPVVLAFFVFRVFLQAPGLCFET